MKTKLTAWGQLFRLPNIFTVPGDPLVGFIVLSNGQLKPEHGLHVGLVLFASICLYLCGLITNDIVDIDIDKKERPDRPLATGVISLFSARCAALLCAMLGLTSSYIIGLHTFAFSLILLLFIIFYNFAFKSHVVFGPLLLALCRISSIMLGASVATGANLQVQPLYFILPTVFFYIYGVSVVAQHETETRAHRRGRVPILASIFIVTLTLILFIITLFSAKGNSDSGLSTILFGMLLYVWFAIVSFHHVMLFTRTQPPEVIQKGIGALIRNLMILQAAWCALSGLPIIACVIILLAYNARQASKKFYGS